MEAFSVDRKSISTTSLPNSSINNSIQVIVDGCHNGVSVEYFMTDLRALYPESKFDLWVIVGMGKDKNVDTMMSHIQQISNKIILSKSRHFRAMSKFSLVSSLNDSFIHFISFHLF